MDNAKAAQDGLIKAQKEAMGALLQEAADRSARSAAERDIADIQKQTAEKIKKIDVEIKDAKEELKKAIDRAKTAYDAEAAIAGGGVWNPNNAAIGGRFGGRRGASANNVDNQPWQDFAKPEGWDQRWAQTHSAEAARRGIDAGLSKKEQNEYDRLAGKFASNPEGMQDSERKRLRELAERDPARKAAKAQEEADKRAKELEAKQKQKEQIQERAYKDIAEIKQYLEGLGLK